VTSSVRQVLALVVVRWQMLRSPGARVGTVLTAGVVLWLLQAVSRAGTLLDEAVLVTALEVAPGAFLGFGVLALIAPLTAGGGHHIVPPDELVAFPVRPATHFLAGLLLAPVNLVWAVQLLALVALTSVLTAGGSFALAAITTAAFVAALTVSGQAVAWLVVGARQSRRGRMAVGCLTSTLLGGALVLAQSGNLGLLVDATAADELILTLIAAGSGDVARWWPATACLLAVSAVAYVVGSVACGWALRRPSDARMLRHTATLRRRRPPSTPLRALLAADRASVWRAPALRRGGLVLVLLPGLAVATLQVPWESLIVLPGLVAAGAGLLFGVNAFALDASGSLWLASLPVSPRLRLLSKGLVLAETVVAAVVVAALAGAVRSTTAPTPAQLTAVVGAGAACAAVVIALSLRSSLARPHRAELQGPRDAVAPPGALAAASARLALPCAAIGMLIAASANTDTAWLPLLVAVPIVLAAVLSVMRTVRRWDDPHLRARVLQTVAAG